MFPGPAAPAFVEFYGEFKFWATATFDLSRDALHIHVGLALYIALRLLGRGRLRTGTVWLLVLALTLLGEVPDYLMLRQYGVAFDAWPHLHDVLNTMVWPSALAALGTLDLEWRKGQGGRRVDVSSPRKLARSAEEGRPRSA